ncbi:MAG TPA: LLM class F420-dependent oxidoreductase [Ktedonobacterales bacterium]|nr:LLM class F420-dependent oxidoreductase [Ktedonobacterales bacterium]
MTQAAPHAARRLRVGVDLHPQHCTYAQYAEAVRRADALGVDTIWTWDHFFPVYGPADGPHFEGWTLLSAMAVLTQRAEIGCLVTAATYRNPALLSNMAKTVDHISGGRLILGLGGGWNRRDHEEYGYELGTPGSRLATLERSLQIIRERWAKDVPPPLRNPIPILIGGGGERVTLRLTAQFADLWHGFGEDVAEYRHKLDVLDVWCAKVGRDPAQVERVVSPQDVSEQQEHAVFDAYVEAGATHILLDAGYSASNTDDPWNLAAIERLVQWRDARNG